MAAPYPYEFRDLVPLNPDEPTCEEVTRIMETLPGLMERWWSFWYNDDGTLTQACLKFLPLDDVEAIELRPDVPRLAIEFLGLDDDPRLFIRVGDALELLPTAESADLIFVDLYTDVGPGVGHLAWTFLENCQKKLNPGGWLVINQWATDDGKPLGAALLRGLYHRHYWELPVKEGNVILLVPADLDQELDLAALSARAEGLAPQLGYSLHSLIKAIRPAT